MKKKLLLVFIIVLMTATVYAAKIKVTFVWDRNIEPDLAGYNLCQSSISGMYQNDRIVPIIEDANTYTLQIDATTDQYFVMTAVDDFGNESDYSNEVIFIVDPSIPAPPKGFGIKNYTIIIIQ